MAFTPLMNDLKHELKTVSSISIFPDAEDVLEDSMNLNWHPFDVFRPCVRTAGYLRNHHRYSPYDALRTTGRNRKHGDCLSCEVIPTVTKDGFQVCMDVSNFKPNELTVKTVDRSVVIEGKHEERKDEHGHIERHFVRKYELPKDYDPNDVVSTISSDGILTVKAAPPPALSKTNERIVHIQHTGPADLFVKQQAEEVTTEDLANGRQEGMDVK